METLNAVYEGGKTGLANAPPLNSLDTKFPGCFKMSNPPSPAIFLKSVHYFLTVEELQLTMSDKQKPLVTASCCFYPPPMTVRPLHQASGWKYVDLWPYIITWSCGLQWSLLCIWVSCHSLKKAEIWSDITWNNSRPLNNWHAGRKPLQKWPTCINDGFCYCSAHHLSSSPNRFCQHICWG